MGTRDQLMTVISTDGQITLPKAIRDQLHWVAGTQLTVESTTEGLLLRSLPMFSSTSVDALFGSMRHTRPALSISDMNTAIPQEAARRARD